MSKRIWDFWAHFLYDVHLCATEYGVRRDQGVRGEKDNDAPRGQNKIQCVSGLNTVLEILN